MWIDDGINGFSKNLGLVYVCWSVFDWWKHINMDDILPFWVIMRHESYWNEGDHIWSSGCGECFNMSHTATKTSWWPNKVIWIFWKFKFFGDVSSGVETWPFLEYGRGIPIYGSALAPWVFGVHKMSLTLLLVKWSEMMSRYLQNKN